LNPVERHPVVAVLLALTAMVVVVPVAVQVAGREYRASHAWPYLLVAAGMLTVAAGYGIFRETWQGVLAGVGFVMALAGMIALQRRARR
jgi:hypothetical protein